MKKRGIKSMKITKMLVLIIIIITLLATFSYSYVYTDTRTVYVTDTGSKYHAYGCDYLRSKPHKTTVATAINKGYAPCKVCDPYRISN